MITTEKLLTMAETMRIVRIESRMTFYKIIVPMELKQADPSRYRHFIGYIDQNHGGTYRKRRFPRSEVEAYCKHVNLYDQPNSI